MDGGSEPAEVHFLVHAPEGAPPRLRLEQGGAERGKQQRDRLDQEAAHVPRHVRWRRRVGRVLQQRGAERDAQVRPWHNLAGNFTDEVHLAYGRRPKVTQSPNGAKDGILGHGHGHNRVAVERAKSPGCGPCPHLDPVDAQGTHERLDDGAGRTGPSVGWHIRSEAPGAGGGDTLHGGRLQARHEHGCAAMEKAGASQCARGGRDPLRVFLLRLAEGCHFDPRQPHDVISASEPEDGRYQTTVSGRLDESLRAVQTVEVDRARGDGHAKVLGQRLRT